MNRRDFIGSGIASGLVGLAAMERAEGRDKEDEGRFPAPSPLSFRDEKSGLKITNIRAARLVPKRPLPKYQPSPGSWNTKRSRSPIRCRSIRDSSRGVRLFLRRRPRPRNGMSRRTRGSRGLATAARGRPSLSTRHLPKLLVGEDPFRVERLWDIMWRGTLYYGRRGIAVHAISAVDNALWDIVGKALKVARLSAVGRCRPATRSLLLHGQQHRASGRSSGSRSSSSPSLTAPPTASQGLEKNEQLVQRARRLLGTDGEIMLDCWMASDRGLRRDAGRTARALPGLLDGRMPDARRLRGHGTLERKGPVHADGDRRT